MSGERYPPTREVAFVIALTAGASASRAPALSPTEQAAIMRVLCDGELEKDAQGWICRDPGTDDFGQPWEQRWLSAWRGRFVVRPDEWLVSLERPCMGSFCPREAYILRKVRGTWRRTHELQVDKGIDDDCLPLGGMADGFDRLVCLDTAGPHQGFMFERLSVRSFAGGEEKTQPLMQKSQGGECFLSDPGLPEHHDDVLTLSREAAPDRQAAFTAHLQVRRGPCDPARRDKDVPVVVKSQHVLRFIRRGNDVVPDAATAAIIQAEGWSPGKD